MTIQNMNTTKSWQNGALITKRCGHLYDGTALIYLASPYTHPSPTLQHIRYEQAQEATATLMKEGKVVFSPITHCHHLAIAHKMPGHFAFWQDYCLGFLSKCDEIVLLPLPGWEDSKGVTAELNFAKRLDIPMRVLEDFDKYIPNTKIGCNAYETFKPLLK